MKIIKLLQDRLLGKLTLLTVTASSVKICQGSKSLEYNLPQTFQGYNYLNHTEEMASWMLAVLQEKKIRIRRCRFVLDTEQVYCQTVKLPSMTVQEQHNWIRWEGSQYIPFKSGTYQAVLIPWSETADLRDVQDNQAMGVPGFSAEWKPTEKAQMKFFLLVAVSLETIEAVQQFASYFKIKLEEVTAIGPQQVVLPTNLLSVVSGKEIILRWGYKVATVLCLLISLFLAVRSGFRWQHAKSAWQEADFQLIPLRTVKTAYNESKQSDYKIRMYQQELLNIGRTEVAWSSILREMGRIIPEGCWLVALQQKQTQYRWLEIKGCALNFDQVSEFLKKLERSEAFLQIRLVESSAKRIELKGRGDSSKTVVSFLLLAELAPLREEGMP